MKHIYAPALTAAMLALSVVAAPLQAATAAAPAAPPTTATIAKVNDDPISLQEVLDTFNARHSGHSKFLGGEVEMKKFLDIVIEDRLLIQEAYDIGLDSDPELKAAVDEYERGLCVKKLVLEETELKARPTQDEVKAVYETLNTIRQVRQITVATRQEAEEIRNSIMRGCDVDYFVRNCSLARASKMGGHIMATWGAVTEEWEKVVFPLEVGEISPVIETPAGFDVVIMENRVAVPPPDFSKVKSDIEATLYKRRLDQRQTAYSTELRERYHAQVNAVPLDARALGDLLGSAPETVVATWDGGKLTLRETYDPEELKQLEAAPRAQQRAEIEKRIRITVNEPLVALDAEQKKIAEREDIASDVTHFLEYNMEALLYRDHIFKDMKVSDEEVRAYYEAKKSQFELPEQRRVSQILTATEADAKAAAVRLAKGEKFEEVAMEVSRDFMTAQKGGDLGWIAASNVPPSFAEILEMKAGDVTKPIKDAGGWHIIKLVEVKPKGSRTFEDVKEEVTKRVTDEKKKVTRASWVDKLRAVSHIQYEEATIKAFVAANEFDEKAAPPQHSMQ